MLLRSVSRELVSCYRDGDGQPILREGVDEEPRLDIWVHNRGEDAHESQLIVTLPEELSFVGVDDRVFKNY